MWHKTTSRRFALAINPTVSLDEARDCLRDHELMLKMFYGSAQIDRVDSTNEGTSRESVYSITVNGSKTQATFEDLDDLPGVAIRDRLELGITVLTRWHVLTSSSEHCRTGMMLVEETKVQIPRLLWLALPFSAEQSASIKTRLLTAVMEIRHRRPDLSREDVVRQAKELAIGVNLQQNGYDPKEQEKQ